MVIDGKDFRQLADCVDASTNFGRRACDPRRAGEWDGPPLERSFSALHEALKASDMIDPVQIVRMTAAACLMSEVQANA
jgi:hypothetical protein